MYSALDRVQAIIEFELDGTIVDANANFLATLGYTIDEVRGKHHAMFLRSGLQRPAPNTSSSGRAWGRGEFDPRRLPAGSAQERQGHLDPAPPTIPLLRRPGQTGARDQVRHRHHGAEAGPTPNADRQDRRHLQVAGR